VIFYLSVQPYFYSYLLVVHSQSVASAGHITQTFSLSSAVTSVIISLLIKYTRHYKWYAVSGTLIYILGIGLMIRHRSGTVPSLIGCQIMLGIGGGMLSVPAQLGVQASVPRRHVAAATAAFMTLVEIGGAVGAAVSGVVWAGLVPAKLAEYLPEAARGDASAIYASVVVAGSYALESPERIAIQRSYSETMRVLLVIAICMCVPLVLLSLSMADYKLDRVEDGVKHEAVGAMVGDGETNDDETHRNKGSEIKRHL
jgi:MFS family permease